MPTTLINKKSLTFAYASSPDAHEYNNNRACWIVKAPDVLAVFQEHGKYDALKFFESLTYGIDHTVSFTKDHKVFND